MSVFDLDLPLNQRLDNMSDMMGRLGIGPSMGERKDDAIVLASAVRACESCGAGEACHAWLARAAASLYRAPAFCPNADRFAQLIAGELAALRRKLASH
jgi:hypothetical protein